jgi:hypothetical protein
MGGRAVLARQVDAVAPRVPREVHDRGPDVAQPAQQVERLRRHARDELERVWTRSATASGG